MSTPSQTTSRTSSKSQSSRELPSLRANPIVGSNWFQLLELIPPKLQFTDISCNSDRVPNTFQGECQFLARIWSKRLRLLRDEEAELTNQLLRRRIDNWEQALTEMAQIESDGRIFLLGGSNLFEQELQPEHWVKEAWPLLLSYQQEHNYVPEKEMRSALKKALLTGPFNQEELNQYFGDSEQEEAESELSQIAGLLREDEILFWSWVYPEFPRVFLTKNEEKSGVLPES